MVSESNLEARERVFTLWKARTKPKDISRATGIPYSTVTWHIRKIEAHLEGYQLDRMGAHDYILTYLQCKMSMEDKAHDIEVDLATEKDPARIDRLRAQLLDYNIAIWKMQDEGPAVVAMRKYKKDAEARANSQQAREATA